MNMDRRKMIELADVLKNRLSGGLICCLVLVAAYLYQRFCPGMYVDALSSSIYISMWLTLFLIALLWTLRERNTQMLPSEVTDWAFVASFLLMTSDQIYFLLPKELHERIAPVVSVYTLPALAVGGIVMAGLIKLLVSLYRLLDSERRKSALQAEQLRVLLASPLPEDKSLLLVRKLIINESIFQLSSTERYLLMEGCRKIDPDFFVWLREQKIVLPERDVFFCVLVRMKKKKEEIVSILKIVDDRTYRTMVSRARKRLRAADVDLETFLCELQSIVT